MLTLRKLRKLLHQSTRKWGRSRAPILCHLCPLAAGKHTATTRHLSALVTPAGKAYECQAQQTITMASSDHQKAIVLLLSEVRIQPFDISSDFVYGEGKWVAGSYLDIIWKKKAGGIFCGSCGLFLNFAATNKAHVSKCIACKC